MYIYDSFHATPATFTTSFNLDAVNDAIYQQLRSFGTKPSMLRGGINLIDYYTPGPAFTELAPTIHRGKYEHKLAALDRTLSIAFNRRAYFASDLIHFDQLDADELTELGTADPLDTLETEYDSNLKLNQLLDKLTDRQRDVALLLSTGASQTETATALGISKNRVGVIVNKIRARLS